MPKIMLDPVKQAEQFKADLAAMKVGQKQQDGPPQQRMLTKNFGVASFRYNEWSATLTEHQQIEDTLQPQFWDGQAAQIMGHDKVNPRGLLDLIHVRKPDTMEYVVLLVVGVGKGFVKTVPVQGYSPTDATAAITDGAPLSTRWNPGKKVHEVLRKADHQVMASDFQSKADAAAWIADHMAKMAN